MPHEITGSAAPGLHFRHFQDQPAPSRTGPDHPVNSCALARMNLEGYSQYVLRRPYQQGDVVCRRRGRWGHLALLFAPASGRVTRRQIPAASSTAPMPSARQQHILEKGKNSTKRAARWADDAAQMIERAARWWRLMRSALELSNETLRDFPNRQPAAMRAALAQSARSSPRVSAAYRRGDFSHRRPAEVGEPVAAFRDVGLTQGDARAGRPAVAVADAASPRVAHAGRTRVEMLRRPPADLRRANSSSMLLVLEAARPGSKRKPRPARPSTSASIRSSNAQMGRAEPLPQVGGEHGELRYLPLGVGIVIPPGTSRCDPGGHDRGGAGGRQYGRAEASSDTPTVAAKFVAVLASRLPGRVLHAAGGAAARLAICWSRIAHAFRLLHRLARSRPAHQRTRGPAARGPALDQARRRRNGGKDPSSSTTRPISTPPRRACWLRPRLSGPEVLACSRAIVVDSVYDAFLAKLVPWCRRCKPARARTRAITWAR